MAKSEWTVDTLKIYLEEKIKHLDDTIKGNKELFETKLADAQKASDKLETSQREAIVKADALIKQNKDDANEWRTQSKDREATWTPLTTSVRNEQDVKKVTEDLPKMINQLRTELMLPITELQKSTGKVEAKKEGAKDYFKDILAILGLVGMAIALLMKH